MKKTILALVVICSSLALSSCGSTCCSNSYEYTNYDSGCCGAANYSSIWY
ncbi:hypothetical protein [Legionella waltersii]|nr:hypothetical protein [Legionella waltersii]